MASDSTIYSYYITYVTKYGEAPEKLQSNNDTYNNNQEVMLPTLSYPYANFVGWYLTETFDEDSKVELGDYANASSGDRTLYAKWEPTERHLVSAMDVYALAEAVRAKAGTTAGILPQDIPAAIRALAGGGELISFTVAPSRYIAGSFTPVTYSAEAGMTFGNWLDSEYNVDGWYYEDSLFCIWSPSYGILCADISATGFVQLTDTISDGAVYYAG